MAARSFSRYSIIVLAILAVTGAFAQQPELGKCSERPQVITGAYFVDYLRWCVERVIDAHDIEPYAFTALETAPDGTLYATRPLSGEVVAISDSDGDDLPDAMSTFAAGLTLPNGLAWRQGDLYVSGGPHIYRVSEIGEIVTIVDDLPTGTGYPTGGLAVGPDDRLYVGIGAPCDNCAYDDAERGAILSMALDGSQRRIEATGFRWPADVAFYRNALWTVDSAPRSRLDGALDELNMVEDGGWYGYPYCLGENQRHLENEAINCADAIAPRMLFGAGAVPTSLAAYPYATLTGTADTLIVVLSGEPTQIDFVGYKVVMLNFDAAGRPLGATILLPYRIESRRSAYLPYDGEGYFWRQYITLHEQGWGIYPQQPLAVAVDHHGWIYVSLTGGEIIVLRPANATPPWDDFYPIWTPMHPDFDPTIRPGASDQSAG